jgi:hypothetical protein
MDPAELLRQVAGVFERLGLPYLVTGSTATIYYGEPRFTNDIDVVVQLPQERIAELCAAFPEADFYLSEEAVRRAVARQGQFNLIHPASGLKVDVMIPAPTPFNRSRFERTVRLRTGPEGDAAFASPEDVILKKLEYYLAGRSEKHLRDIAGVLRVSGERIDRSYITEWAARLGVAEVWDHVLRQMDAAAAP